MSSRSLNKVLLIGNLTRDPELRYTPQGTPVCTFGLATNRSWVPSTGGDRQEETEFHRIVSWQKLAELCSQLLFKGRKVYVEGRLQTRSWTSQDGQERSATEVVIDNMIILDSRRRPGEETVEADSSQSAPASQPQVQAEPKAEEKKKTTKAVKKVEPKKEAVSPSAGGEKSEEVKADDIPF